MSIEFLDKEGLSKLWQRAKEKFVAKEAGKCLSDNNYTDEDKDKLQSLKSSDMSLIWAFELPLELKTNLYPTGNHHLNLKKGRIVISYPEIPETLVDTKPTFYIAQETGGKYIVASSYDETPLKTKGALPIYVSEFEIVGCDRLVVDSYSGDSAINATTGTKKVSGFSTTNYKCTMNLSKKSTETDYAVNSLRVYGRFLKGTKIELWGC